MKTSHVVLRQVEDADGVRLLEASLTVEGNVLLTGHDLGAGVERLFGAREYEWAWTIPAAVVPALLRALGAAKDVLSALEARFGGDDAALLGSFLEAPKIPTDRGSRLGD